MHIVVFGAGYVGLVQAAGLTSLGNSVTVIEPNPEKIKLIRQGKSPIYEPGLEDLIQKANSNKLLQVISTESDQIHTEINSADIVFIAVGTPEGADGKADLSVLFNVAKQIGTAYKKEKPLVVSIKSTVPVGTGDKAETLIREMGAKVSVTSNPEFLKQSHAVEDFLRPERIIIGAEDAGAREVLTALYRPLMLKRERIVYMSRRSAELTKYACNAFLATKISFINEMAQICEKVGANVHEIREGMITDSRIGEQFLYPGIGYGGSCLPKDTHALYESAKDFGLSLNVVAAIDKVNVQQKNWPLQKLRQQFKSLSGKKIGIWGLAFKANTDDLREAPSIEIVKELCREGATVVAHDALALQNAEKVFAKEIETKRLQLVSRPLEAVEGVEALIVLTEASIYRSPQWQDIVNLMSKKIVIDGRNIYDAKQMRGLGFVYSGVGVP